MRACVVRCPSATVGFSQMTDAMEILALSLIGPSLVCEWRIQAWELALLTSVRTVKKAFEMVNCGVMKEG